MKNSIIWVITALFSLTAWVTPSQAEDAATILFDYPDAVLLLDDEPAAYREADTILVEPGSHNITLYLPPRDNQWLPSILSRPYVLSENDTITISPHTIHYLHIRTVPDGAKIFLNRRFLGYTPHAISTIHPLDTNLGLEKAGFRTETVFLQDLKPGSPIDLSLEPAVTRRDSDELLIATETGNGHSWGWLPYATLSYFVASTAIGFYNKGRADDLYEEYLATASRNRMDDLFERAEVLDNRARLFWITGEVALGATIYLFVKKFKQNRGDRPQPALSFGLSPRGERGVFLSLEYRGSGK